MSNTTESSHDLVRADGASEFPNNQFIFSEPICNDSNILINANEKENLLLTNALRLQFNSVIESPKDPRVVERHSTEADVPLLKMENEKSSVTHSSPNPVLFQLAEEIPQSFKMNIAKNSQEETLGTPIETGSSDFFGSRLHSQIVIDNSLRSELSNSLNSDTLQNESGCLPSLLLPVVSEIISYQNNTHNEQVVPTGSPSCTYPPTTSIWSQIQRRAQQIDAKVVHSPQHPMEHAARYKGSSQSPNSENNSCVDESFGFVIDTNGVRTQSDNGFQVINHNYQQGDNMPPSHENELQMNNPRGGESINNEFERVQDSMGEQNMENAAYNTRNPGRSGRRNERGVQNRGRNAMRRSDLNNQDVGMMNDTMEDVIVDTWITERHLRERPSRTLFVRNVYFECTEKELRDHFTRFGAIRDFFSKISCRGIAFITFYDLRHAQSAKEALNNVDIGPRKVDVHYSLPRDTVTPNTKCDASKNQGTVFVVVDDQDAKEIPEETLQRYFSQYGEVKGITQTKSSSGQKRQIFVEFFDSRAAQIFIESENEKSIEGSRISLEYAWDKATKQSVYLGIRSREKDSAHRGRRHGHGSGDELVGESTQDRRLGRSNLQGESNYESRGRNAQVNNNRRRGGVRQTSNQRRGGRSSRERGERTGRDYPINRRDDEYSSRNQNGSQGYSFDRDQRGSGRVIDPRKHQRSNSRARNEHYNDGNDQYLQQNNSNVLQNSSQQQFYGQNGGNLSAEQAQSLLLAATGQMGYVPPSQNMNYQQYQRHHNDQSSQNFHGLPTPAIPVNSLPQTVASSLNLLTSILQQQQQQQPASSGYQQSSSMTPVAAAVSQLTAIFQSLQQHQSSAPLQQTLNNPNPSSIPVVRQQNNTRLPTSLPPQPPQIQNHQQFNNQQKQQNQFGRISEVGFYQNQNQYQQPQKSVQQRQTAGQVVGQNVGNALPASDFHYEQFAQYLAQLEGGQK